MVTSHVLTSASVEVLLYQGHVYICEELLEWVMDSLWQWFRFTKKRCKTSCEQDVLLL